MSKRREDTYVKNDLVDTVLRNILTVTCASPTGATLHFRWCVSLIDAANEVHRTYGTGVLDVYNGNTGALVSQLAMPQQGTQGSLGGGGLAVAWATVDAAGSTTLNCTATLAAYGASTFAVDIAYEQRGHVNGLLDVVEAT